MSSTDRPVALVTGALGDIGRATSSALVGAGYDVVLTDLAPDDAADAGIAAIGAEHSRYRRLDTTSPEECAQVIASLARLDLVVANAGVVHAQPFLEIEPGEWSRQIEVNLSGAFFITQAGARRMAADGTPGSLVYVSSWVASRPWPEITAYAASKAGIEQLMRQAALELSVRGIRANAVAPGIVRAGMARHQLETEPAYAARAATAVPLGELQTAEQIADVVVWLASSGASSMTGSTVVIDGGASLGTVH